MKCRKCQQENPENSSFCGKCGTRLEYKETPFLTKTLETPQDELTRGTLFADRYEIIEELGAGGMGKVYRAFDKKIEEEVAIKLIRPEIATDKKTVDRFRKELKIARKISHKNVCRMHDLGEEGKTLFITMEYVRGEDLKSFIRRTKVLATGTAISIARQVAEGLEEAHRLGVIHRDLKPSNIMIDKEGNAKIMDFGIAHFSGGAGTTVEGALIGTPEYMSPEQVEGRPADGRSDLYALGSILFEMVTGRVLFEGENFVAIAHKHKYESPTDPQSINPQISSELAQLILRCLEKESEARYQTTGELLAGLEEVEAKLPVSEKAPSAQSLLKAKPRTSKTVTVNITPRRIITVAVVIVIVALAAYFIQRYGSVKPTPIASAGKPSLAILYFENISQEPSLDDWKTGLTELMITDLSQSKYINVFSGDVVYGLLKKLELENSSRYSSNDLKRISEISGVSHIGIGSIMKAGENIVITFGLRKPRTGETLTPHKIEFRGEKEIMSAVDELTRLVKSDMNVSASQILSDFDGDLANISTPSPEAFRYYSEGRKYHQLGDYYQSIELMKKATAIDPGFAMAYRSMATAYGNLGNLVEDRKCMKKALEYSSRASERERLYIQGRAEGIWDAERGIEIFQKYIALYPEDASGYNYLGHFNRSLERWKEACEHFLRNVDLASNKEAISGPASLAPTYQALGMYDKAKVLLEGYINNYSENPVILYHLASNFLCMGEYDQATAAIDNAIAQNPNDLRIRLKGDIFHCQGDPEKATAEYRKLLRLEIAQSSINGWLRLGSLDVLQGKRVQSIVEYGKALEIALKRDDKYSEFLVRSSRCYSFIGLGLFEDGLSEAEQLKESAKAIYRPNWHANIFPAYYEGLCHIKMHSPDRALNAAAEIMAQNPQKPEMRFYLQILGLIELEAKNNAKAIGYFKEALSLMHYQWNYDHSNENALFLDSLASAYFQAGDLANARKRYEEITRLTLGRLDYGDIYARSFYWLGRICERQSDEREARTNYQKFLELWKDADPGLPEVEDARKRVAGLTGS